MSVENKSLTEAIIERTLRVPKRFDVNGERQSEAISRQLDIALISAGFKADAKLLEHVANLHPSDATGYARSIASSVKTLVGDHVSHNTYFKEFPDNVPDTLEFWGQLVSATFGVDNETLWSGNLLELDGYGTYNHTYEEMLKAHQEFMPKTTDKLKIVTLGGSLAEESYQLYLSLAESKVPANGADLELLKELAIVCINDVQPEKIPVRENKAVINQVRLDNGADIEVDTVTDVLRLMAHLSEGDVSLQEKTKFKNVNRKTRKVILTALDKVIASNPGKLGDVFKHREQYKRLDEVLHSRDYPRLVNAQKVFETARNDINLSFESQVEKAFAEGNTKTVAELLSKNPGMFVRNFNRLILQASIKDLPQVTRSLSEVLPSVSTTVILGLRQYINNRNGNLTHRLFINKKGTGKVVENTLPTIDQGILAPVVELLDRAVMNRMPKGTYIIDPNVLSVALPLSNRQTNSGFNTMPRGSVDTIEGEILRLFCYWKEQHGRTDYDLSAVFLDEDFKQVGQVSYTNLTMTGVKHSGDVVGSNKGASEFIDIDPAKISDKIKYVMGMVNNYSGEDFNSVEESFFGYMGRDLEQKGKPFEAATVKTKGELRGAHKVALPLVFIREGDSWTVKWLNSSLKGYSWGNATENNTLNSAVLTRALVETDYLTVNYLVDLLTRGKGTAVVISKPEDIDFDEIAEDVDVTYIGKDLSLTLPDRVKTITLSNLHELL
jgi:stress response protein SCP2